MGVNKAPQHAHGDRREPSAWRTRNLVPLASAFLTPSTASLCRGWPWTIKDQINYHSMAVFNFNDNSPWHFSKVTRRGRCDFLEAIMWCFQYVLVSFRMLGDKRARETSSDWRQSGIRRISYECNNYGNWWWRNMLKYPQKAWSAQPTAAETGWL